MAGLCRRPYIRKKRVNCINKGNFAMGFPKVRMRRLRANETVRRLLRQTSLSVDNLIYPLFVKEGRGIKEPIETFEAA